MSVLTILLILTSVLLPGDQIETVIGGASQYAPHVMERVIGVRQSGVTAKDLPLDLPEVDGYVAMADAEWIGKVIKLRPLTQPKYETFLVVDCGGFADGGYDWMIRNNILVEVDYETAVRWNTVGRLIEVAFLYNPTGKLEYTKKIVEWR